MTSIVHRRQSSQQDHTTSKLERAKSKTCPGFFYTGSHKGSVDMGRVNTEPDTVSQPEIAVNYANVLPSKVRYGNSQVMPLIPQNLEKVPKSDVALLKKVIHNSTYTLAQSTQKNAEFNKRSTAYMLSKDTATERQAQS